MRLALAALAILALIMLLKWQFPYAATSEQDHMRMLYLVALLALVGSGVLHIRRHELPQTIKYAAIWLGVILLLIFAYSFRDGFMNNRLMAELIPHRAQVSEGGVLTIRSGEDGHFNLEARINGVPVLFMVDTGASDIVLSPRDAKRIGFEPETLNFSRVYQTANGTVRGAPVRINMLEIGEVRMHDLPASVNGVPMGRSLLGMTFLRRLKSYQVEGNSLTLAP